MDEWGFGMASVRFICGTQTQHTAARGAAVGVPRHRGDDPLQLVLRRQRRCLRGALRRRGRDRLRRAQPRLDHRRHPAQQGGAVPVQERRHGRPAGPARGGPRRWRAAGLRGHRRGVLDGRLLRPARRDLRPGRRVRGDGARRRLPRRGVRRRRRPGHARAVRRDGPGRHHHGHARQGARWGVRRLRREPPGGRRPAAPALAPLPVLQLGRTGRRGRVARRAGPRVGLERGARDAARQRRPVPRADDGGRVRAAAGVAPHHAGDVPR